MKAMAMTRTEPALPRITSAAAGMTSPDSASSVVICIKTRIQTCYHRPMPQEA